jgi:chemotaxis methyl-accepting protein methylase
MRNLTAQITAHLVKCHQCDVSVYDEDFLQKAITSRLHLTGSENPGSYLADLLENPEESILLMESLTNPTSQFFRHPLSFALLEQSIIPRIFGLNNRKPKHELRVWSAGCSAGQEPYSIALLASEHCQNAQNGHTFRIFATDRSERELDTGRKGIYNFGMLHNVRAVHLKNYFSQSGDSYRISGFIKKRVEFSYHDLLDPNSVAPPGSIYGDFDIISCCNVLLYYKPEVRKMILRKFHTSLQEGGFFITGEAESPIAAEIPGFRPFAPPAPIFIKTRL